MQFGHKYINMAQGPSEADGVHRVATAFWEYLVREGGPEGRPVMWVEDDEVELALNVSSHGQQALRVLQSVIHSPQHHVLDQDVASMLARGGPTGKQLAEGCQQNIQRVPDHRQQAMSYVELQEHMDVHIGRNGQSNTFWEKRGSAMMLYLDLTAYPGRRMTSDKDMKPRIPEQFTNLNSPFPSSI
jgi:hypothetical protein